MKIKDSKPFKEHLSACERQFGKGYFGVSDGSPPMKAEAVEKHAQAIYNELTGQGLTYMNAILIMDIVHEQLRIDRDTHSL